MAQACDKRRVMERLADDLRRTIAITDALPETLVSVRLAEALDEIEKRLAAMDQ